MGEYLVCCFLLPGPSYGLSISVPGYVGSVNVYSFADQATLLESLARIGLTLNQQDAVLAGVSSSAMYMLSGVSITDAVAASFGVVLHNGSIPNQSNSIAFTACNGSGQPLSVQAVVNNQIMPAAATGCFPWSTVSSCLVSSGALSQAQVNALQQSLTASGSAQTTWIGNGLTVVKCFNN
jgi:hypothetical protein